MDPINSMWTEKYRPRKLDDLVFKDKDKIRNYLSNNKSMQHLIFYSLTPGSGKTSMGKIIINELGADALVLNASDDRKIETVREKITEFVRTKSSVSDVRRIVLLDEADGLTSASQDALRNLMETYAANALFILTANNVSKIIDAIKSRCVSINFSMPDKEEIYKYLENICVKENLEYTKEGIDYLIKNNYPSIRNCVQALQEIKTENKTVRTEDISEIEDEYTKLWRIITEQKDWKLVKDYVFKNDVDIQTLNKFFWYKAVEASNIKLIQITCSNADKFRNNGDEVVIFVTSLIDMVK